MADDDEKDMFIELSKISDRNPENLNERWTKIFRYVCGGLGISSSVLAFYLIYAWTKLNHKGGTGGLVWRTPAKPFHPKGYINYHVLSMCISFLLLMGPSMITFEMFPLERHTNKNIHNYLNTMALFAGIGGLGIAIDYNKNKPIRSVHAVVGYSTLTLLTLNFLGGFTMYVWGKGGAMRGSLKPLHKRAGLFTLIAGLTNILIGLMEKQSYGRYDEKTRKATQKIAFVVLFAMFNIFCCVTKYVDKKDPPKDD